MITKRNRKLFLLFDILLLVILLVLCYFIYTYTWVRMEIKAYFRVYWAMHNLGVFLFALLFQLERIINIINNRKRIYVRWETMILSLVFIFLGCIKLWYSFMGPLELEPGGALFLIRQSILSSDFWDYVLMASAGILFVRAFVIKKDESQADEACDKDKE